MLLNILEIIFLRQNKMWYIVNELEIGLLLIMKSSWGLLIKIFSS